MKTRLILIFVTLLALGGAFAGTTLAASPDPDSPVPLVPLQRVTATEALLQASPIPRPTGSPRAATAATPHPILSDVRVRRAIAYCTDKAGLLASVYPDLTAEQRQALIADTFIRPTSWAYSAPATVYPYAPTTGQGLLEDAGWHLAPDATYRTRDGKELVLILRTTTANFRVTFLTVFEAQMRACGIHVIREHLNADWFFGSSTPTGISVRDFELSDFAYVIEDADPGGRTLFACDQIPTPANGWRGQNCPGWCNAAASNAIVTASDTALSQGQRKAAYAVVIDAVAADLPLLPLFWRYDFTTGQPSETWEHIEFNLETFSQDAEVTPATPSTLNFADYAGNTGSVAAPSGAVTQSITLSYYPLVASAHPIPDSSAAFSPFRLTAAVRGVPQAAYEFSAPVTLTLRYDDAGIPFLHEETLNLFRWSGDTGWQPAQESCPEGERYYHVDRTANVVVVQVCQLSEFTLMGASQNYLPLEVGKGWRYTWQNSVHAADPLVETVWTAARDGSNYILRTHNRLGSGEFSLSTAYGYKFTDYSMEGQNPFPAPMNSLLSYLFVPTQLLPGQWRVGDQMTGGAYFNEQVYTGTTTIVTNTAAVLAAGKPFTDCLHLETVITGPNTYVAGTRALWFAPDVGLVKMIYQHSDGSVTTAEFVEPVIMRSIFLPQVRTD